MTSRELVNLTINCENPPRAPRHMWLLPWTKMFLAEELARIQERFPDDIVVSPEYMTIQPYTEGDPHLKGKYTDPWGCVFDNAQDGIIGQVKQPLVRDEDWKDVDKVHIPTEWLSVDIDKVNEFCANEDRYVLGWGRPRPFEQLQFIRGTQNLYLDLVDPPKKMLEFMDKMHQFYCQLLEFWAKTDVDGLRIMDDWGSQRSLLISPEMWRKYFKPMYEDYVRIAHSHGKKIFMHSDGYILDLYPELIEIGIDVLNSQIFCIGVDKLAPYAGKICFWGEVDRQHMLPYGTTQQAAEAVQLVYDTLWKNGGCIAELEFGIGANPKNVEAVFAAWDHISMKQTGSCDVSP